MMETVKLKASVMAVSCLLLVAVGGQSRSLTNPAAGHQLARDRTHKAAACDYSVLNDGTADANASLVFADGGNPGPEKTALLVISRGDPRKPRVLFTREIGAGAAGSLHIGDMTGNGKQEVFVFVDGQKTSAEMLRFRGSTASVLYRLDEGRPHVFLRYRDTKSGIVADIVEEWPAHQLALENTPGFKGHPVALKVFRWNGKRYQQHHIEPADKWVEGKASGWPSTKLDREVG